LLRGLVLLPITIVQEAVYIDKNDIILAKYSVLLDSTEQNMARLNKKLEDEGEWVRKKGL
jgi:hypothetical protein